MAKYQIYLTSDRGTRVTLLDQFTELEYTKVVNDVGVLRGLWPAEAFDPAWLTDDYRVEVWRAAMDDSPYMLDFAGFLRAYQQSTRDGIAEVAANWTDYNELLARRIVAYADGSAQADQTDEADDMMKKIVRQNLGDECVDNARNLTAWGLAVEAYTALGPSIEKKFSRRVVLDVLQELSDAAATKGTRVYFALEPRPDATCLFRTWVGQPGSDRTYPGGNNPVLVGLEYGNLLEPALEHDATAEENYIYAGGVGEGDVRTIQVASSAARIGVSAVGRREGWVDATNADTDAGVESEAEAALEERKAVDRFSGTLIEIPACIYGRDWGLGDRVTATYRGQTHDCLVKTVTVHITAAQGAVVNAALELLDD